MRRPVRRWSQIDGLHVGGHVLLATIGVDGAADAHLLRTRHRAHREQPSLAHLWLGTGDNETSTQRTSIVHRGYGLATMEILTQQADTDNPMQQRAHISTGRQKG